MDCEQVRNTWVILLPITSTLILIVSYTEHPVWFLSPKNQNDQKKMLYLLRKWRTNQKSNLGVDN